MPILYPKHMFQFRPKIFVLLSFILIFQSCSKSEDNKTTVTPTPINTNFVPAATADIVMYEINPQAFSSTKNIQGIINRLDNIKALGINTIWIMPIHPVGVVNSFGSPYCVKNYTDVKSSFGTLSDLKILVEQAHTRKIAVILDWVANHTAWDNQWIYDHPNWYTKNASGQIISPAGTNWNDVADLDFSNQSMRLAMIDAMKYWVVNANIDGFRCDAADYVPYDFWLQANTALKAIPNKNLILLAEGSRADHFSAGFQINFAWDYLGTIKNVFGANTGAVTNLFTTNTSEYNSVPIGKEKLRFTTNHDESNIASPISVYGSKNGALAASVITTFLKGVPLLYCGQEVGVSSTAVYNGANTIDWSANNDMLLAYQNMMAFYNASATARYGNLITFPTNTNVAIFQKSTASEQVLFLVNARNTAQTVTIAATLQGNWTNALTGEAVTLSGSVALTGFQYMILKK